MYLMVALWRGMEAGEKRPAVVAAAKEFTGTTAVPGPLLTLADQAIAGRGNYMKLIATAWGFQSHGRGECKLCLLRLISRSRKSHLQITWASGVCLCWDVSQAPF